MFSRPLYTMEPLRKVKNNNIYCFLTNVHKKHVFFPKKWSILYGENGFYLKQAEKGLFLRLRSGSKIALYCSGQITLGNRLPPRGENRTTFDIMAKTIKNRITN